MIYILDTDILILMMRGLKTKVAKTETQKQRVAQANLFLQPAVPTLRMDTPSVVQPSPWQS